MHLSFSIPEGFDIAEILEKREFFIEDGEEFSIARYKESNLFPIVSTYVLATAAFSKSRL